MNTLEKRVEDLPYMLNHLDYSHFKEKDYHMKLQEKIKKYTSIVAVGVMFTFLTISQAEANTLTYQKTFKPEVGISTYSCNSYIKSGEPTSGQVVLANPTDKTVISKLTMTIVGKTAVDKANIVQSKPSHVSIKIPAYQEVTYEFTNGATAIVKKDITAYILMKTEKEERKGKEFKIIAPFK